MQAMMKISYEMAKKLSELDEGVELYGLDSRDGTEWLLETAEDFDNVADRNDFDFGIEGELFGKPYAEPIHIKVEDQSEEYRFEVVATCTHQNTHADSIEHYDEYMEAVTGLPQPIHYEAVEVCDRCGAVYSISTEEWTEQN